MSNRSFNIILNFNEIFLAILGISSFFLAIYPQNIVYYPHENAFRFSLGLTAIFILSLSVINFKSLSLRLDKIAFSWALIFFIFFSFLKPIFLSQEENIWTEVASEMLKRKVVEKVCILEKNPTNFSYYFANLSSVFIIHKPQDLTLCQRKSLILIPVYEVSSSLPFAKKAKIVTLPKTLVKKPKYLAFIFL